MVMSVFAYLTATKKLPYFACPFALGSFFMGTVFAAVFITTVSEETAIFYKKTFCSQFVPGKPAAGHDQQTKTDVAKTMDMFFIDRFMCSEICPCHLLSQPLWQDKYEEKEMKKRLRTYNTVATPPVTALTFIGTDEAKKTAENPAGKVFENFDQCYAANIHDKWDNIPKPYNDDAAHAAYLEFSKPTSIKNLRYFENHFECSGVCNVPLFYLTKSTQEGPPTTDCAESVIHSIKGNVGLMMVSLIGMLSFWWAALATVPNCCGKKKGKGKMKGKHYELSEDVTNMNTTRDQTNIK